jgi:hypothetical protein
LVSKIILLDSGPLGLLCHQFAGPQVVAARNHLDLVSQAGHRVVIPEIIDYELRRELIRIGSGNGLSSLNWLGVHFDYLSVTTTALRLAADLWARARATGRTASSARLDVDVILTAQALTLGVPNVVIATGNVKHFTMNVVADLWENIQ